METEEGERGAEERLSAFEKEQVPHPQHALRGQLIKETHEPGHEHRAQPVTVELGSCQLSEI